MSLPLPQSSGNHVQPLSPIPPSMPDNRCLKCALPPLVDSLQKGWQSSCSSAAVVSTLFTGVSSQLLGNVLSLKGSPTSDAHPHAVTFLLIVSYAAIILNSSATVTSLLLIDRLGDLPVKSSSGEKHRDHYRVRWIEKDLDILAEYGIGKAWSWTLWHWLIALIMGIFCIFLQVLTYVYLQESVAVQVTMTCAVGFSVLPLIQWIPSRVYRRPTHSTTQ